MFYNYCILVFGYFPLTPHKTDVLFRCSVCVRYKNVRGRYGTNTPLAPAGFFGQVLNAFFTPNSFWLLGFPAQPQKK